MNESETLVQRDLQWYWKGGDLVANSRKPVVGHAYHYRIRAERLGLDWVFTPARTDQALGLADPLSYNSTCGAKARCQRRENQILEKAKAAAEAAESNRVAPIAIAPKTLADVLEHIDALRVLAAAVRCEMLEQMRK